MSDTPVPPPPAPAAPAVEDNTAAIIGYLFGIGLIIGAVMHSSNKTQVGAYHLRQALGILLLAIGGTIVFVVLGIVCAFLGGIPFVGWFLLHGLGLLAWVFRIGLLVLTVLGLLAASKRELTPLPVIGGPCQKFFGSLFG